MTVLVTSKERGANVLALYLFVLAGYEMVGAALLVGMGGVPLLLDSTLGLSWILPLHTDVQLGLMWFFKGMIWLFFGLMFFRRGLVIGPIYLVVASILAVPSIFVIGSILISGGGHVLTSADLVVPMGVLLVVYVLPGYLASKGRRLPHPSQHLADGTE